MDTIIYNNFISLNYLSHDNYRQSIFYKTIFSINYVNIKNDKKCIDLQVNRVDEKFNET